MVLNEGQDLGAKDLDAHPADVEVVVDSAPEVQEEGEKVATPPGAFGGPGGGCCRKRPSGSDSACSRSCA